MEPPSVRLVSQTHHVACRLDCCWYSHVQQQEQQAKLPPRQRRTT
jgi:hypothetical protein